MNQRGSPTIFAGVDGGQAEGLACTDQGARTLIGASGNYNDILLLKNQSHVLNLILVSYSIKKIVELHYSVKLHNTQP